MSEHAMEKGSELKEKLSRHIDEAKAKLDVLKKDIESMAEEDRQKLAAKRDEISKKAHEHK